VTNNDILDVKYHSVELHDKALLVFYGKNLKTMSDVYQAEMHRQFLFIANAMGYDVTLRAVELNGEET
jgi:hypothetical protein